MSRSEDVVRGDDVVQEEHDNVVLDALKEKVAHLEEQVTNLLDNFDAVLKQSDTFKAMTSPLHFENNLERSPAFIQLLRIVDELKHDRETHFPESTFDDVVDSMRISLYGSRKRKFSIAAADAVAGGATGGATVQKRKTPSGTPTNRPKGRPPAGKVWNTELGQYEKIK